MKKVLIVCNADPNSNPRPNRMINWLKADYEVEVLGLSRLRMDGIKSYVIEPFTRGMSIHSSTATLKRIIRRNFNLLSGNYEEVNWSRLGNVKGLAVELAQNKYDLIISHDLVLLPLVFKMKDASTRVMLDAREYYTENYSDQWLWRMLSRPVNEYLCREYLRRCDKVITVSTGLADKYHHVYGVHPEVIMSLPARWGLQPLSSKVDHIRLIHHGFAGKSRRTEIMLDVMDHVDERFTLDLMLVVNDTKYHQMIVSLAGQRKNVRVIPAVPMQEIIPTINHYDIGLYLLPPTNFNIEYALPNKIFEFIQARLAVAIGPSTEMRKIVEKYNCGIVSKDFNPLSLARRLNELTTDEIVRYKENACKAAQELNAEANAQRVRQIVRDLTEN